MKKQAEFDPIFAFFFRLYSFLCVRTFVFWILTRIIVFYNAATCGCCPCLRLTKLTLTKRAFSREHTSPPILILTLQNLITSFPVAKGWRAWLTKFGDNRTWIGARKLFTNIYLHTEYWRRRKQLPIPSPLVGNVITPKNRLLHFTSLNLLCLI